MIGGQVTHLTPERKKYCDELANRRNDPEFLSKRVDRPLSAEEKSCIEDTYSLNAVSDFRFLTGKSLKKRFEVRSLRDLFDHRYALYDFEANYEFLSQRRTGLRLIIEAIRRRHHGDPIDLFLSGPSPKASASYIPAWRTLIKYYEPPIQMMHHGKKVLWPGNTVTSISHELGHMLMHTLYKTMPNFHGKDTHAEDRSRRSDQQSSPGGAWAEGFAEAVAHLDSEFGSIVEPSEFHTNDRWIKRPLREKISNEYVVHAALLDFLRAGTYDDKWNLVARGDFAQQRFQRVVSVMEHAGVQDSFQEFLVDYMTDFPPL